MPAWTRTLQRWLHGPPSVVWHPEYRLPITSLVARTNLDPRRPDLALDALVELGVLGADDALSPPRIGWDALAKVHTPEWLDEVTRPETLARIFAVEAWDVPADALIDSIRRGCGGTLLAANRALANGGPVMNLLGGFHHAGPGFGAGFCALNDVAVAIAELRAHGKAATVAILDLDAHPPDGLSACLGTTAWIGSISGTPWDVPAGVDETLLPPQSGDEAYLAALDGLLSRLPKADLTFVLAGGDIRAGDAFGALAVSEAGARERDRRVAAALGGRPSVWLPAGGYRPDAWRVLAGTALVLAGEPDAKLPADLDPLRARFRRVGAELSGSFGEIRLEASDLDEALGQRREDPRFLGAYTRAQIELALERYGMLEPVRRLGYTELRVEFDTAELGDRVRLYGRAQGAEHLLAESVLARERYQESELLFIHWLTLRHPLGAFRAGRPPLPGQEVPGLGLAREAGELHRRIAERLGLAAVALRPAWFHVARAGRDYMQFVDPVEQGRFQALLRDLGHIPAGELSRACQAGRVRLNGEAWTWPAGLMAEWVVPRPVDRAAIDAAAAAAHFTLLPP